MPTKAKSDAVLTQSLAADSLPAIDSDVETLTAADGLNQAGSPVPTGSRRAVGGRVRGGERAVAQQDGTAVHGIHALSDLLGALRVGNAPVTSAAPISPLRAAGSESQVQDVAWTDKKGAKAGLRVSRRNAKPADAQAMHPDGSSGQGPMQEDAFGAEGFTEPPRVTPDSLALASRLEEGKRKLAARQQQAKERALREQLARESQYDQRVLQEAFPWWDEEHRGVPNPFIRSGLFSVKTGDDREYLKEFEIASLSNYQITYTGDELRQEDLSVWMALIHMARQQAIGDMVLFSAYQLIKDLDWRMHSETYQTIKESITRLKVTEIKISTRDPDGKVRAYAGALIRDYAFDEVADNGMPRWMVRFESKISTLFMADTTSLLEWEIRKKIGRKAALAQWLHNFYCSHREPLPLSVAKIHQLSRSNSQLSTFRRNLRLALQKLKEIGFLRDFEVRNDLVYVTKVNFRRMQAASSVGSGALGMAEA